MESLRPATDVAVYDWSSLNAALECSRIEHCGSSLPGGSSYTGVGLRFIKLGSTHVLQLILSSLSVQTSSDCVTLFFENIYGVY